MYEWHGYGGGMMWFFWILFLLVLILLVATFARRGNSKPDSGKTALDILQERYARGEITRDEYRQMRDDLEE